jgi:hypothetical protein
MKKRDAYVDDDDDEIVPDGGSVRVPMRMMDSARRLADHRPGFRVGDATDRKAVRDARTEMIRRAENAWRDARRKRDEEGEDDEDEDETDDARARRWDARAISDARAAATAAYVARTHRMTDAWRLRPSRDGAGGPDAEEMLRRHLRDAGGEPDAATQLLRGGEPDSNNAEGLLRRICAAMSPTTSRPAAMPRGVATATISRTPGRPTRAPPPRSSGRASGGEAADKGRRSAASA